jgi:hypothetical protein
MPMVCQSNTYKTALPKHGYMHKSASHASPADHEASFCSSNFSSSCLLSSRAFSDKRKAEEKQCKQKSSVDSNLEKRGSPLSPTLKQNLQFPRHDFEFALLLEPSTLVVDDLGHVFQPLPFKIVSSTQSGRGLGKRDI